MTEAEWWAATDPGPMLAFLRQRRRATERKLRLFARHCFYRLHPHGISDEAFLAVDFAELFADGEVSADDFAAARALGFAGLDPYGFTAEAVWPAFAAATARAAADMPAAAGHVLQALGYILVGPSRAEELQAEREGLCHLLRDLFNPFAAVRLDPALRAWNGGTVVKLAAQLYAEGTPPDGSFDPYRLAILADALEEAAAAPALLGHLRQQGGVHVRGCWAVDLLLGKE